jgi:hypothetical protein
VQIVFYTSFVSCMYNCNHITNILSTTYVTTSHNIYYLLCSAPDIRKCSWTNPCQAIVVCIARSQEELLKTCTFNIFIRTFYKKYSFNTYDLCKRQQLNNISSRAVNWGGGIFWRSWLASALTSSNNNNNKHDDDKGVHAE